MRVFWLLVLAATFFSGTAAEAQKRVALVIGNSAYANVSRLTNPSNDAAAFAATLKNAAFDEVEIKRDLKASEMRRVLRDFADTARDADIAVVYYAGHGIEVDGSNYLIPIDAALERDVDVFDETIPVDRILSVIDPAKQLRLVILDACRDNPFAKTMKRSVGQRSVGRGFAKVEPSSPNTLIAFASKAGSTAADGDTTNSPFTTALVKHIATPGLDLRRAFGFVRDDVLKSTGNRQEPYVYGSLGGDDFPLVPAKPVAAAPSAINPNAEIRRDYELALQIATRQVWTAFLKQYPDGFYAALATEQLNKIAADEAKAAAAEKARLAQEEKARLAAEGARLAEQKKAAQLAEAAEKAKLAAEQKQLIEAAKAKAAEESRAALERAAAEKAATAQAEAARLAEAEEAAAKAAAEKAAAAAQSKSNQQVAALPPDAPGPAAPDNSPTDISRSIQTELRRVGCHTEKIDDQWSAVARRSLEKFNKRAGMKLDVKLASIDTLDAIKAKPSRICPLECERGYRADGERCFKITCGPESFLNEDNECEKKRETIRAPKKPDIRKSDNAQSESMKSSKQFFCNQSGCRSISKGCRIGEVSVAADPTRKVVGEICN